MYKNQKNQKNFFCLKKNIIIMKMTKISKEVLNKLAKKAGIKSLSGLTYEEIIGTVLVMI